VASQLYGLSRTDPWTLSAVSDCVADGGVAACCIPSQTGNAIDPVVVVAVRVSVLLWWVHRIYRCYDAKSPREHLQVDHGMLYWHLVAIFLGKLEKYA